MYRLKVGFNAFIKLNWPGVAFHTTYLIYINALNRPLSNLVSEIIFSKTIFTTHSYLLTRMERSPDHVCRLSTMSQEKKCDVTKKCDGRTDTGQKR